MSRPLAALGKTLAFTLLVPATVAGWIPWSLVVSGLHRFVRNPMYIGVGLIIAGQAWLFHSLAIAIYLALFGLLVHLFVVFYEEPALQRQFGAEYKCYRATVPRWIPKIRF